MANLKTESEKTHWHSFCRGDSWRVFVFLFELTVERSLDTEISTGDLELRWEIDGRDQKFGKL
jgi:hypothetical protein